MTHPWHAPQVRRPRYMGARDVGSWQGTMETMAWVSILINVVLLATSWTLRDHFVIPLMVASRSEDACDTTTLPELITPFGAWSGTNISWSDERCGRNYELCFAEVGAVPWLPASVYLDEKAYRSESYLDLLCDSTSAISDGAHHDENKCAICSERQPRWWAARTVLQKPRPGVHFELPRHRRGGHQPPAEHKLVGELVVRGLKSWPGAARKE